MWSRLIDFVPLLAGYALIQKGPDDRGIDYRELYLNTILVWYISARLTYVLSHISHYVGQLTSTVQLSFDNLSVLGGVIGSIFYLFFLSKRKKLEFWLMLRTYTRLYYWLVSWWMLIGLYKLKWFPLLIPRDTFGVMLIKFVLFFLAFIIENRLEAKKEKWHISSSLFVAIVIVNIILSSF